jgi:tetratricopeptide (TPR) repeat protein
MGLKQERQERRRSLDYTGEAGPGDSGAPLFLPDGRVVAIVVGPRKFKKDRKREYVPSAEPIGSLLELLACYDLDRKFGIALDRTGLEFPGIHPDERADRSRRAVNLVTEALELLNDRRYHDAGERCREAIQLAPTYANAYVARARVYAGYCKRNRSTLAPESYTRMMEWAADDARRAIELDDSDVGSELVKSILEVMLKQDGLHRRAREAILHCDEVLSDLFLSDDERSYAFGIRAQMKEVIGDWEAATRDLSEAIRLDPEDADWYRERARCWDNLLRTERAREDRRKAEQLDRQLKLKRQAPGRSDSSARR